MPANFTQRTAPFHRYSRDTPHLTIGTTGIYLLRRSVKQALASRRLAPVLECQIRAFSIDLRSVVIHRIVTTPTGKAAVRQ